MNPHKKILVVDDEAINLEFFEVMLSRLGFLVEKAEDGLDALEKIKRFHPDLIMLDNIMPRMSGWELTKALKATVEYRDIPIIMFSALDDVKDKLESFELGVEDYITKPFNFSEVLARIRVVFRNRELLNLVAAREARLEVINQDMKNQIKDCVDKLTELSPSIDSVHNQALQEIFGKVMQRVADLNDLLEKSGAEIEAFKKHDFSPPQE
jgi:DNA-binding response OmpR family regulator